jgi:branched-chain amino acid transport system substrate-binding protein
MAAMKKSYFLILLVLTAFLLGCPAQVVVLPTPDKPKEVRVDKEQALFDKAEKHLSQDSHADALVFYKQYMQQFPDKPLSAKALLRMGSIYFELKDYDKAQAAFERLLNDHPKSDLLPEAKVTLLKINYKKGAYDLVVQEARTLLETTIPRFLDYQIYGIVGDSHLALGDAPLATYAYAMALDLAFEDDQTAVLAKFKETVRMLDVDATSALIEQVTSPEPYSYLFFHLGMRQIDEEKYEQALVTLTQFSDMFPNHENAQLARDMLAELEQRAIYQRHTIGCLLPLSGRYKAIGQKALRGIELAVYRFKQQNDLPELRLVVKDTAGDDETAREAVRALAQQKIAAVIGPVITAAVAAEEAQLQGLPIITLTQKENITNIGDFVFRHFITPRMQVRALAEYVTGKLRAKRIAILYPNDRYGRTFMNLFWDALLENEAQVVALEHYNPRHTDFAEPIKKLVGLHYPLPYFLKRKIKSATNRFEHDEEDAGDAFNNDIPIDDKKPEAIVDFDAVFIPDEPKTAGLIIPQLVYYDIAKTYFLGTNLWHSTKFIDMAHGYIKRAIIPDIFFARSKSPVVRAYVEDFKSVYGEDSGLIEAIAYDTAAILLSVISRPEVLFRSSIKGALQTLDTYNGVTGQTSFDETGEAKKSLYLLRVKRKQFFEIEPN